MMARRANVTLLVLLLVAVAIRLGVPRSHLGVEPAGWEIVLPLRIGAVLSAIAAGACLGTSGLLLQALLRNPLASPFILGLSSGAVLGVALATWAAWLGVAWLAALDGLLPATVGSLASLACVWFLGRRRGTIDPLTMVIAGACVASVFGAITLLVESLIPPVARAPILTFALGRIPELPAWGVLTAVAGLAGLGIAGSRVMARALDVASASDLEATAMGVNLARLRLWLFGLSGVLAAGAVVLCGPLAFVGFLAPHAARFLGGAGHRGLAFGAPIAGATILLLADSLRQVLDFGAGRPPVGVLTALCGAIALLVLLHRARLPEDER